MLQLLKPCGEEVSLYVAVVAYCSDRGTVRLLSVDGGVPCEAVMSDVSLRDAAEGLVVKLVGDSQQRDLTYPLVLEDVADGKRRLVFVFAIALSEGACGNNPAAWTSLHDFVRDADPTAVFVVTEALRRL